MRIMLPLVSLAFAASAATYAAEPPPHGCDTPEARQFDFWVGEWDLSYRNEGRIEHSRNRITKILDGCALLEEFTGPPGTPLEGRSLSTFDRLTHRWNQTWTDNTASYLDFAGGFTGDRMVLSREAERDGKRFLQRMVWQDIRAGSLKWLWQRSDDGGKTWNTQWEIDYRRTG